MTILPTIILVICVICGTPTLSAALFSLRFKNGRPKENMPARRYSVRVSCIVRLVA